MDRRTCLVSSSSVAPTTELPLAKAADRARCHHGTARRPSRRLLDDRAAAGESSTAEPRSAIPLLDAYEIEWITRELDRLIVGSRQEGTRSETTAAAATAERGRETTAKPAGGFWARHAVGLCSPKEGVVEPVASTSVGRRRVPSAGGSLSFLVR
ncbi:hypothetical protein GW17_00015691 [Ensete ventricosum]|nr:hypothetical protein GW17_00015691 [Ensete ventricosum]